MSLSKIESLKTQAKVIEKTFPTILELISMIKNRYKEMDYNEFELLKKHMIDALYQRFEVKIDFQNQIDDFIITPDSLKIYRKFRILLGRIDTKNLKLNNENQMSEMLKIFGDSFTLRDLRDRFLDENNQLLINNNGFNTVQFYRQLDKVALQINSIPFED